MSTVNCRKVDLASDSDCADLLHLLRTYAQDDMGGGEDLAPFVKENLVAELRKRAALVHAFIASVEGEPAGLAICFEGFSTFACAPLLNIHDFITSPAFRRRGVGSALLHFVEEDARRLGCCKLTLEVLTGNAAAKSLYVTHGFGSYELDPAVGHAVFWQKKLT